MGIIKPSTKNDDGMVVTCVDHCVLCDDAELGRIGFDNLEFDSSHATTNQEGVTFSDGSIG